MFIILIVVMVLLYIYMSKMNQIVKFKYVQFILYKLYPQ